MRRNWLLITMGKVGSGKSYANIELALILDPTFNISRIVFTKSDFMALVRAGLPPGSFILAEEIGTWFSNREFLSQGNIGLSKIIQTFRQQRLGVIFNLPHFRMVDKNLRTMGDASLEMIDVDRQNNIGIGKYKITSVNPQTSDLYAKFPKMYSGKDTVTITRVKIHKPPEDIIKLYEEKKKEHMERFNAMIHHSFDKEDAEENEDIPKGSNKKYKFTCRKCGTSGFTNRNIKKHWDDCGGKLDIEENA